MGVFRDEGDDVARAQAEAGETSGKAGDAVVELCKSEGVIAGMVEVDKSGAIGEGGVGSEGCEDFGDGREILDDGRGEARRAARYGVRDGLGGGDGDVRGTGGGRGGGAAADGTAGETDGGGREGVGGRE